MILIFIVFIVLAVTLIISYSTFRNQDENSTDAWFDDNTTSTPSLTTLTFKPTEDPHSVSSENYSPTTTTETDPETSTSSFTDETENPSELFNINKREQWGSLPMKGKIKLKVPLTRVIIMDTKTDTCEEPTACESFVRKRQADTFATSVHGFGLNDIRENFLIASDGTIYEGRGFTYEGQHTYDSGSTTYNNDVIGVSCIGDFNNIQPNQSQVDALKFFIKKSIEDANLIGDYKLYFIEQLIGSNDINNCLYETVKSFGNWKPSKYFPVVMVIEEILFVFYCFSSTNSKEI